METGRLVMQIGFRTIDLGENIRRRISSAKEIFVLLKHEHRHVEFTRSVDD